MSVYADVNIPFARRYVAGEGGGKGGFRDIPARTNLFTSYHVRGPSLVSRLRRPDFVEILRLPET